LNKRLSILLSLIIGPMIGATAFTSVIIPNNLMGGGIGGLAQLLNKTTGLNLQLLLASMFLPIAVWAFFRYGIKQIITASISFILFTVFMGITPLIVPILKTDAILAAIVSGVLLGVSGGIVLRLGVSNGPEALIGMHLKEKFNLQMGVFMTIFNSIIILLSLFKADMTIALYSAISIYISGKITDFIILGFGRYYELNIITKEYIMVSSFIQTEIKRGVTYIQCVGAYELNNKMMIKTLVKSDEIVKIKNYIKSVDLECFIYINESSEVIGTGFKN
jgi:uncharacterized membrane-anchored protein YitT (DUF2179 family)